MFSCVVDFEKDLAMKWRDEIQEDSGGMRKISQELDHDMSKTTS